MAGYAMIVELKFGPVTGCDGCESNEENGERSCGSCSMEEPNDSERLVSGGERSEETVRRWLGGVL
jgi:hypothetical protein